MADLDDLLGGGAAAKPVDLGDMDDLLGGGGGGASAAPAKAAFDDMDDLLGDTGGAAPQPAATEPKTTANRAAPRGDMDFTTAASPTKTRRRSKPITIPTLSRDIVSNDLRKYVNEATFYARFVQTIDKQDKRVRVVLAVTDTEVCVMNDECQAVHSMPIGQVIGAITQTTTVEKMFSKKTEDLLLVQGESERDIFVSLIKDDANGDTSSMLNVVQVLTAICMAHGVALPVSELKEGENIVDMVKFAAMAADDRVRKQLTEALAFRTEIVNEIQRLLKQENQQEVAITAIKSSDAGQAAGDINNDITKSKELVSQYQAKIEHLNGQKKLLLTDLDAAQKRIEEEESVRQAEVQKTVEAASQETVMRQLAEYETMKSAHKREIDKISALSGFMERRVAGLGNGKCSGIGQVSDRIDDLEDDYAFLTEKLGQTSEEHSRRIKALAEAKKRTADAKEVVAALEEEVQTLKDLPEGEELPSHIGKSEPPSIEPVKVGKAPEKPAASPAAAAPAAAAKPAIDLDDDDDDSPGLPPAPAPAAPKPAINLDDDDDI